MTFHKKLQSLWLLSHIILAYSLIMHFSIIGVIAAVIWALIINIGTEAGGHRYFVHRSYKTSRIKERSMLFLQTLCGEGSILSFCGVHRQHHAFTDTDKDPHSPVTRTLISVVYWLSPVNINPRYVSDWIKDRYVRFQHDHYFKIHAALFLIITAIFGIAVYGYVISLSVVATLYANAATNIIGHTRNLGYRRYDTSDNSVNVGGIINVLLMGGALQNNHHGNQSSYTNKMHDSEHDSIGWIIKVFIKND